MRKHSRVTGIWVLLLALVLGPSACSSTGPEEGVPPAAKAAKAAGSSEPFEYVKPRKFDTHKQSLELNDVHAKFMGLDWYAMGNLVNTFDAPVHHIKLQITALDAEGKPIAVSEATTALEPVAPGVSYPFFNAFKAPREWEPRVEVKVVEFQTDR